MKRLKYFDHATKVNPAMDMQKEIDLMDILKSNGIKDAVWALRCFEYRNYCLFLADIAESVLPIFEKKYPKDDRPGKAIQAIRDYKDGKITKQNLKEIAISAYDAHDKAAYAAAYAASYVYNDAYVAYTAYFTAEAAAEAYYDVNYIAVANYSYADAFASVARQKKWLDIEKLFIKYFGGEQ